MVCFVDGDGGGWADWQSVKINTILNRLQREMESGRLGCLVKDSGSLLGSFHVLFNIPCYAHQYAILLLPPCSVRDPSISYLNVEA